MDGLHVVVTQNIRIIVSNMVSQHIHQQNSELESKGMLTLFNVKEMDSKKDIMRLMILELNKYNKYLEELKKMPEDNSVAIELPKKKKMPKMNDPKEADYF